MFNYYQKCYERIKLKYRSFYRSSVYIRDLKLFKLKLLKGNKAFLFL